MFFCLQISLCRELQHMGLGWSKHSGSAIKPSLWLLKRTLKTKESPFRLFREAYGRNKYCLTAPLNAQPNKLSSHGTVNLEAKSPAGGGNNLMNPCTLLITLDGLHRDIRYIINRFKLVEESSTLPRWLS